MQVLRTPHTHTHTTHSHTHTLTQNFLDNIAKADRCRTADWPGHSEAIKLMTLIKINSGCKRREAAPLQVAIIYSKRVANTKEIISTQCCIHLSASLSVEQVANRMWMMINDSQAGEWHRVYPIPFATWTQMNK